MSYWATFTAALSVVALIVGTVTRIIARLSRCSSRKTHFLGFSFCWLAYFLFWLIQQSVRIRFLPHSLSDLGHSLLSDVVAVLLMGAFAQLAGKIAIIGASKEGAGDPSLTQLHNGKGGRHEAL
jgi:hypothetical protein